MLLSVQFIIHCMAGFFALLSDHSRRGSYEKWDCQAASMKLAARPVQQAGTVVLHQKLFEV